MIWGLTLQPGQPCTRELKEVIHLSLATLESRAEQGKNQSYSQVVIATEDSEQLLCTLVHGMIFQQCLDIKLMPQEKVTFTAQGSSTVFITGYTGRVPKKQKDEDESMEETGEPGSPNITRTEYQAAGNKEKGDELMIYQEVEMEVTAENQVRSNAAPMTETQSFGAGSDILIKSEVEDNGHDEVDTGPASEHHEGESELQHHLDHDGVHYGDHHGDDGFLPVEDEPEEGDKETSRGEFSSVGVSGDTTTTGNQVGLDGQSAATPHTPESTLIDNTIEGQQRLFQLVRRNIAQRNRRYGRSHYELRKRITRHTLGGKIPGYVEIAAKRRKKSEGFATSDYHATTSSVSGQTSSVGFSPLEKASSQLHHSETECLGSLSQPASPSLSEVQELDSRPLSEPSFANQDYSAMSLLSSSMPGPSSSPVALEIIPHTEKAPPQLNHPESVNNQGSSSQPWSSSLPQIPHPDSQPLTEPSLINQYMPAVSLPPSSMPYISSSGSSYQPQHQETSTPVISCLPTALQSLPLEAALYVSQLEYRIRALESQQETVVKKKKTPSYTEENGFAIIGKEGGPTVKLDVKSYTTAWAKSTSGRELVLKLMPLVFSEEVMATSNYHGGQVFSGQGWVRKNQLRDHPSFVAIIDQSCIEYPGCFNSVEQCKELRDAVNSKCRKARQVIL